MALAYNKVKAANPQYEVGGNSNEAAPTFEWGMRAVVVEIDVLNEAVYMQVLSSMSGEQGDAQWEQELWLSPQHRTISRQGIFGVRFRRGEFTLPEPGPFVTVQAIGENETWPNWNQLSGGR